jgi:hypothetical protein
MFVDIRCPIRVECILSCSTTSALSSKPGTRIYFGPILSFPHRFYTASFLQVISINLGRNALKNKGEKSRIALCDICQVWATNKLIESGPPVVQQEYMMLD